MRENYNIWKIGMQAHLSVIDDDMWYVITDGPIKIQTSTTSTEGILEIKDKPRSEWTTEEKKKNNLDNMVKDILYKTLDDNMFNKIQACTSAKEIWEKLTQLCEGNDKTKENKLKVSTQKYDSIKIRSREIMTDFEERFTSIIIELSTLGKTYNNREVNMKVVKALLRE
ncbi:uncharacterized protein LOC124935161 [Impatiens glandulifera]|uniref:uncharacterized protein LOC124935161 n=1 Tax=Impatiens glandulifera TaxID=253017 RepID=UPI001FB06F08|nr:uncharacterized protein LOC124935161 [Impatiens glandulifera]